MTKCTVPQMDIELGVPPVDISWFPSCAAFLAAGCIIGWGRSYAADAVPLLPVYRCSFCRPQKDDRLSQLSGVNSVANGAQTQDPRIPNQPP